MTTLRDAAQQALEALEYAHDEALDDDHFECRYILSGQITALRAALAEPTVTVRYDLGAAETDEAIRQRLIELGWTPPKAEQPAEQEPVA